VAATVLVVGAGPTGLTMAIELARRGVDVDIIDVSAGPAVETRALGVQARTLELFDRIEVADAAIAKGLPVAAFSVFSENKPIVHVNMRGLDTPYPVHLDVAATRDRIIACSPTCRARRESATAG
jgi:2-polyprenyl-6-methoxyphenol hydroxylase-like FAD-dependent oxidoreductase